VKILLYQWAKANSVILVNAGSLVGTTAVTSVIGFAYWWLAARRFSPEAVGLASAMISTMMLLGTICIFGLGTLLIGELPRQPGKEVSLISAALIVVGGAGACLGVLFALIAPYISSDFQALRTSIQDIVLFAVGVSLTAISLVLDEALIGLLRGELQLWRNTLYAVAKLAALFVASLWLSHKVGLTIYATWVVGNVLSLAPLVGFVVLKGGRPRRIYQPQWGLLRKLGPTALKHHALNLTCLAPVQILPVLVTMLLSAKMNAWFYVSWMIASFVFVIPSALTTVLYATSSAQPSTLAYKIRLTLSLGVLASLLANCVLLLGSKQVLGLFGQDYAEEAVWSLRILTLAAFPIIIRHHYVAVCRIQDRLSQAILFMAAGGIFELSGAALGARLGALSGFSIGWITVVYIESVFMSSVVYKGVKSITASTGVEKSQMSIEDKKDM
jgi:O-antigen/teichoic acid export membrane protein